MRTKITLIIFSIVYSLGATIAWAAPHNIILLIGDGMGFEQVRAAGMYSNGTEGSLVFESFPYQAQVTTYSASDPAYTDSAAAATAMATGTKVNEGVISMAIPGDGSELETLLEYFSDRNKSTGLVTSTHMTNATPAAFGSHESSRYNTAQIAHDFLYQTRPNVLFGGGGYGLTATAAMSADYTVVTDRFEMQGLNTDIETMVSGQFGTDNLPFEYDYSTGSDNSYDVLPHLSEMTETALDILDNDPDGFFLMVEGGRIDHAGHGSNLERNIFETIEFTNTIQKVIDWTQGRSDTLILITADHETGGLQDLQNNGQGVFPEHNWTSNGDHTNANVPIYAWGENAHLVSGVIDNTFVFDIIVGEENSIPFYTDLTSWEANVSDIEVFTTTANNIVLADEVISISGLNDQLGSTLTFETVNTGLSRGFLVSTLQTNAGFTYSETESGNPISEYEDALSIGDINNYEDDDWQLDLLDGATMTAFWVEIRHARFAPGETLTLYSNGSPVSTVDLSILPYTGNATYSIGITSDVPFDTIIFNEDPDGDDIAIADFRFATAGAPTIECTDNDNDDFSTEGGNCGTIDCDDSDNAVNPDKTEIPYNGKDDDCNTLTVDNDIDGDGYVNAIDCDDDNFLINPGAVETCNGIDDNCDQLTDNNLQAILNDNQNGVCAGSLKICDGINGWVNDYSHIDYFEQEELTCTDSEDNDCDGEIDESDNCSYVELNLTVGWNMISLPLAPSDTSIDKVLSSIAGKYKGVWTYDGTWKVYVPDSQFSDLRTMEAGRGYWIYMQEEASLTITGSMPSSSITLNSGWNLVGYNSLMSEEVTQALSSIDGKYTSVWVYKDVSWMKFYSNNSSLSDLTIMDPGYGYWIKMTEDATLTLQ